MNVEAVQAEPAELSLPDPVPQVAQQVPANAPPLEQAQPVAEPAPAQNAPDRGASEISAESIAEEFARPEDRPAERSNIGEESKVLNSDPGEEEEDIGSSLADPEPASTNPPVESNPPAADEPEMAHGYPIELLIANGIDPAILDEIPEDLRGELLQGVDS